MLGLQHLKVLLWFEKKFQYCFAIVDYNFYNIGRNQNFVYIFQ